MLARHTPQSLMVMTWNRDAKRWVSDYVEQSKTLDYYEGYGIRETVRLPSWLHMDAIATMCNNSGQIAEYVKHGYDFMIVTVGNYKSICVGTQNIHPSGSVKKKTNKRLR